MARRIALLLAALLLACLLGEGLLRLGSPAISTLPALDPPLGPRQPGELRILVHGGSTSAGQPTPEWGFAAQLQHALSQRFDDRPVRVASLGVPGADSDAVLPRVLESLWLQPDALVILSAHNEFLRQQVPTRLGQALMRSRLLARLLAALLPTEPLPVEFDLENHESSWERAALFNAKLERHQQNLRDMLAAAREAGVAVVFVTGPRNLADWPPAWDRAARARRKPDAVSACATARQLLSAGKHGPALAAARQALDADALDAEALFLAGQAQRALGQYEAARESLRLAADNDPVPYRVLSEQNAALTTLASGPGVNVAHGEAALAAHSEQGLPGFDLFQDNVHPTALGNALLAQEVERAVCVLLGLPPAPQEPAAQRLQSFFDAELPPALLRSLQVRTWKWQAAYCLKVPFENFDAARLHLAPLLGTRGEDWTVWANLATASFLAGERERALDELSRARQLGGEAFNPLARGRVPMLVEAAARHGVRVLDGP